MYKILTIILVFLGHISISQPTADHGLFQGLESSLHATIALRPYVADSNTIIYSGNAQHIGLDTSYHSGGNRFQFFYSYFDTTTRIIHNTKTMLLMRNLSYSSFLRMAFSSVASNPCPINGIDQTWIYSTVNEEHWEQFYSDVLFKKKSASIIAEVDVIFGREKRLIREVFVFAFSNNSFTLRSIISISDENICR